MNSENNSTKIASFKKKRSGKKIFLQKVIKQRLQLLEELTQINRKIDLYFKTQEKNKPKVLSEVLEKSEFQVKIGIKFEELFTFVESELNKNKRDKSA